MDWWPALFFVEQKKIKEKDTCAFSYRASLFFDFLFLPCNEGKLFLIFKLQPITFAP